MDREFGAKTNKMRTMMIILFMGVLMAGISALYLSGAIDPLLAAFTGHSGCGGCHGPAATYAGGDHVTSWTGTLHDTALTAPPAGCERCHELESTLPKRLRSSITDNLGVSHPVTDNDNTVCYACHAAGTGAFSGQTAFEATKHFTAESSGQAITRYPDASYPSGMCGGCHNPHGQAGTTDYTRASANTLCTNCHDDAALPPKPAGYSYQEETTFTGTEHGSSANPYNIWPDPADTGASVGTGGSVSGQCINCHNPHGKSYSYLTLAKEENLCYGGSGASGGCHASINGSVSGINIYSQFSAASDPLSRHSLSDSEQSTGGSKVECANCHNPHMVNATNKATDPDNKSSAYTATMTDPKDGSNVFNYVGFCDKCHDGTPPEGVTLPPGTINIKSNYESDPPENIPGGINETGDWHGIKAGTGWGGTILAPYSRGMAALVCTDCHESHGSSNVYHFKDTVNGKTGISLTDSSGKGADQLCTACHSSTYHDSCITADCHVTDPVPPILPAGAQPCFYCHNHSGIENWPDPGIPHVTETGCEHCHQLWYPYN